MKRYFPWLVTCLVIGALVGAIMLLGDGSTYSGGALLADAGGGAVAADALLREFKAHHEDVKTALQKAGVKDDELSARMSEIEQMVARRSAGGDVSRDATETWGAQVARQIGANTKGLSSAMPDPRVRFDVKATITSLTTDADGSAGDLIAPDIQRDVRTLARRVPRIRSLFPQGRTLGNVIWWPKQTGFTNLAATVAEGVLKPQSEMKFDNETWTVKTIAHWLIASKQILDDVPVLESLIDSDLRYGLDYVEDNQLLNGAGTGTDLLGVYVNAIAFLAPFEASGLTTTEIDVLLQAIAQVDALDERFPADGIVVNPLDWRRMQSLKDAADHYVGGGPFGPLVQRLWQLPVIPTSAMTARKFCVGAFAAGGHIFDREDATVEASREDSDNWRKNLVTILGEKRLAFVIKRNLFVKGDFDEATG